MLVESLCMLCMTSIIINHVRFRHKFFIRDKLKIRGRHCCFCIIILIYYTHRTVLYKYLHIIIYTYIDTRSTRIQYIHTNCRLLLYGYLYLCNLLGMLEFINNNQFQLHILRQKASYRKIEPKPFTWV